MQRLVDVGQQDAGAVRRQGAGGAGDGRGPAQRVVGVVHRARRESVQRRAHVVGPMTGDHKHVADRRDVGERLHLMGDERNGAPAG